jgi:hypothetical protein
MHVVRQLNQFYLWTVGRGNGAVRQVSAKIQMTVCHSTQVNQIIYVVFGV